MNDKAVYRTAPATPGPLITYVSIQDTYLTNLPQHPNIAYIGFDK